MNRHTFLGWLYSEVTSARGALLALYEELDKLRFVEGPKLEQQYMEQVGELEEAIIRQEIECELLEEKKKLIQAARYLRQPLDMAAIDATIEQLRQEKLQEAIGNPPSDTLPVLSDEDTILIQELYREIVQRYHPQMHPEITESQKDLFLKAQDAYRRRDLAALKLIHQMISSNELPLFNIDVTLSMADEDTPDMRRSFTTDYSLAKQIYSCFCPTVEDAAIQEELNACKGKNEQVSQQLEELKQTFPFNAAGMLADPNQLEEYKKQLAYRRYQAEQTAKRLQKEIQSSVERMSARE